MISIPHPKFSAKDCFESCISQKRCKKEKKELSDCTQIIENAEKEYKRKAASFDLHLFSENSCLEKYINTKNIEKLYKNNFSRRGTETRSKYYDKIMLSATNGLCPLCGVGTASTLDHYLPKSTFPSLSVTPSNLIPCCKDCNIAKKSYTPLLKNDQLLHPYYDILPEDVWLNAYIHDSTDFSIVLFKAEPSTSFQASLKKRIEKNFKDLNLGALYSSNAANEVCGIKSELLKLYESGGDSLIKNSLHERHLSWKAININCWQAALYRCLSSTNLSFKIWLQ